MGENMKSASLPVKKNVEVPFWFNPYSELYKLVYDEVCEPVKIDQKKSCTALIVGVFEKKETSEEILFQMQELKELVEVLGHICNDKIIQKVDKKNRTFYLGKGKLQELSELVKEKNIDYVVCNDEITPVQFRQIIDWTRVPVIDRTLIALELFARHSYSKESKLQVEIAQMKYLLPRINSISVSKKNAGDRKNGAFLNRGSGESIYELNQRKIKQRINRLQREIEKSKNSKIVQNKKRSNAYKIILVGYTNAGKTSIMNMLSHNDFEVSDQLFVTTFNRFRKIGTLQKKDVLIGDTVGFVSKLPSTWLEGFDSTIQDIISADVVLNVIDAGDPFRKYKEKTVMEILDQVMVDNKKVVHVFNKMDHLGIEQTVLLKKENEHINCVFVSSLEKQDMIFLKSKVWEELNKKTK